MARSSTLPGVRVPDVVWENRLNAMGSTVDMFFPAGSILPGPIPGISARYRKTTYFCMICGARNHKPVSISTLDGYDRQNRVYVPDCIDIYSSAIAHEYMQDLENQLRALAEKNSIPGFSFQKEVGKNRGEFKFPVIKRKFDGFSEQLRAIGEVQGPADHPTKFFAILSNPYTRSKRFTNQYIYNVFSSKDRAIADLTNAQREDKRNGFSEDNIKHLRADAVRAWFEKYKNFTKKGQTLEEFTQGSATVPLIEHFVIIFTADHNAARQVDWEYELDDPEKYPCVEVWYEWGGLHRSAKAVAANNKPFYQPNEDFNLMVEYETITQEERTKYTNNPQALANLNPTRRAAVQNILTRDKKSPEQIELRRQRRAARARVIERRNRNSQELRDELQAKWSDETRNEINLAIADKVQARELRLVEIARNPCRGLTGEDLYNCRQEVERIRCLNKSARARELERTNRALTLLGYSPEDIVKFKELRDSAEDETLEDDFVKAATLLGQYHYEWEHGKQLIPVIEDVTKASFEVQDLRVQLEVENDEILPVSDEAKKAHQDAIDTIKKSIGDRPFIFSVNRRLHSPERLRLKAATQAVLDAHFNFRFSPNNEQSINNLNQAIDNLKNVLNELGEDWVRRNIAKEVNHQAKLAAQQQASLTAQQQNQAGSNSEGGNSEGSNSKSSEGSGEGSGEEV